MKIVTVTHDGQLRLIADSALGRDAMPLFLPAYGEWEGHCRLAVRIGRLGKCVSSKFAMRYVEAMTALLTIHPVDEEEPEWLPLMDSAVTAGSWIAVPEAASLAMACNGQDIAIPDWQSSVIAAITQVTRYATIKTGDIIIPALPAIAVPLQRNTRVEATLMGEPTLSLKVK